MAGELQKVLGRNLRRYRLERGDSQEDFADRMEVHRTYMGSVERGERNLSLRSVEKFAEFSGPVGSTVGPAPHPRYASEA